jgi:NADPH-dependent curcumin reductase CurA
MVMYLKKEREISMLNFSGQVVVVTGAAGGMGRCVEYL